ncbi:MAG: stage V sporulation protein AD [Cellulosilyticaceae bacterium]
MGRVGKQTIVFKEPPVIAEAYATVGPKEGQGPMGQYFHKVLEDELLGEKTWEKAESTMVKQTIEGVLQASKKKPSEIQYVFAGDLQNQICGSYFGVRDFNIPFYGLYGACSTMGEALGLASMIVAGGYADQVIAGASSHYCTAEKQFRYPLEYGGQRPLTQQWTVTGAGYVLIQRSGVGPRIHSITPGKVVDFDVKDVYNMGAVMAPAAVDTILTHLKDTNQRPDDYDVIVTGDLGQCGLEIAIDLAKQAGVDLGSVMTDCGVMMYDDAAQDTHAGGSGCGCSASMFCGYFYKMLREKKYKKVLLVPTGALMSLASTQQGESIPGIAHAVSIWME